MNYNDAFRATAVKEKEERKGKQPWALITGSSRGLGLHLALQLATHELYKHNIILHGRDPEALNQAAEMIQAKGCLADTVCGDLLYRGTMEELIHTAESRQINLLINNAAMYQSGSLGSLSDQGIIDAIQINLLAPILLAKGCLEILRPKQGIVVNINSAAASGPSKGEAIYAATKAGLAGFSKAWKLETMPVRVIDVYLGAMGTRMAAGRPNPELLIRPEAAAATIVSAIRASVHESSIRFDSLDLRRGWY